MGLLSSLLDNFNPLTEAGATQGALGATQQQIAQQNVLTQQGLESRGLDVQQQAIQAQMDRQARAASLNYANQIGEKLLDPNFRADADRFGTLPAWEEMQTRHYLYGSGQYPVDMLNRDTPLPQQRQLGMGDESGEPNAANPLNIILPEHLGGTGDSSGAGDTGGGNAAVPGGTSNAPGTPAGTPPPAPPQGAASTDTLPAAASFAPGSPLPRTPAAGLPADAMAGLSRLSVADTADQEGTPAAPVVPARDSGNPGQGPMNTGTGGGVTVGANTRTISLPPAGTEVGIDAGVFKNQLMPALESARVVMDGNYSATTRLAAAQQYTSTITQMLTNQLTGNQIDQLRQQIALLPAEAQSALISSLSVAAEHNANAKATLDLIDPTAAKFRGEGAAGQGQGALARAEAGVVPYTATTGRIAANAAASTAHAANISAGASVTEAKNVTDQIKNQVDQFAAQPGRAAAATYFDNLVNTMYETRWSQNGTTNAWGGGVNVAGIGPHANSSNGQNAGYQYKVLRVSSAIQLIAAGYSGAWYALKEARVRGVDEDPTHPIPGGSSVQVPNDDVIRGAVLWINGAQAALQKAGPSNSPGYKQTFAMIQAGKSWLDKLPTDAFVVPGVGSSNTTGGAALPNTGGGGNPNPGRTGGG